MRTLDLLDFAMTLADHFRPVVAARQRLDEFQLRQYWMVSRIRLNVWGAKLRDMTDQFEAIEYRSQPLWELEAPLIEEVFAADSVTRIWAALLDSLDHCLGLQEYSPIGRIVMLGHQDARCRVENIILRGKQQGVTTAVRLDGFRASLERWTDLLLAHGSRNPHLSLYCHDDGRFQDFISAYEAGTSSKLSVLRASDVPSLGGATPVITSHGSLHTRMHRHILGTLGNELLLPTNGVLESSSEMRIVSLVDDLQVMLGRCFELGDPYRPGTALD